MSRNHKQGFYNPVNPHKYKGDINNIKFRSSWELSTNRFLDNNINVLEWASEEIVIPYIKPTDGKIHKYYVDYWVKIRDKNNNIRCELWEVKPKKETIPPKVTKGKSIKTQLYERITYEVNKAKWQAASMFAKKNGLIFRIVTEDHLFK